MNFVRISPPLWGEVSSCIIEGIPSLVMPMVFWGQKTKGYPVAKIGAESIQSSPGDQFARELLSTGEMTPTLLWEDASKQQIIIRLSDYHYTVVSKFIV